MKKIIEDENLIVKEITSEEKEVLNCISDLGLSRITIPHKIEENKLVMAKGKVCNRIELDILKLYKECLEPLYNYKVKDFSAGIYAFYSSKNNKITTKQYITYLKEEFDNIENEYKKGLLTELEEVYNNCKSKFYNGYKFILQTNVLNTPFCLLHGDLFSGNILEYNNEYKLIDFEYMRFGIKELELAFLLSWDFITNESICKYSKSIINNDIEKLINAGYINNQQATVIIEFFIPMFFMLACLCASNKIYRDEKEIIKSVISFYDEFYNGRKIW